MEQEKFNKRLPKSITKKASNNGRLSQVKRSKVRF